MFGSRRYPDSSMDFSTRRSIVIESSHRDEPAIRPDDQDVVVKYFFHEGEFWKAVIPLDGIDEVRGQAFNFSKVKTRVGEKGPEIIFGDDGFPKRTIPMLNHLQSRFILKGDHSVRLYRLESDARGDPVHEVNDFVYSVEAVGPVGTRFNLRDACSGSLFSAHRFYSTRQMVFERIVVEGQYVMESPSLPIQESEKRGLLVESLLRSHRAGNQERYYLYRCYRTNNCTSNPFEILDNVVGYRLPQRIGSFLYRLPLNPRFYLRVRGLDVNPGVRKQVRSEFEEYIGAPETKRQKREYVRSQLRAVRAARAGDLQES